jgi:hypothetical protein
MLIAAFIKTSPGMKTRFFNVAISQSHFDLNRAGGAALLITAILLALRQIIKLNRVKTKKYASKY